MSEKENLDIFILKDGMGKGSRKSIKIWNRRSATLQSSEDVEEYLNTERLLTTTSQIASAVELRSIN